MLVKYALRLGIDEFELNFDVKNEKEFFEQASFFSNLPRTAPGGSTDLKLVFRTTKKGHKYYSLVSEKEKMEFKFGQNLEANGGGLFPKGWSQAYQDDADDQPQQATAPLIGQQPSAAAQQFVAPPVAAPTQTFVAPPTIQMPSPVAAPAPIAPTPAATPAAAPAVNPNVANVANNVLARFGIPQNK